MTAIVADTSTPALHPGHLSVREADDGSRRCPKAHHGDGGAQAALEATSFDAPDEVRQLQAHGRVELVHLETGPVGRGTFEPGWRWSNMAAG